MPKKIVKVGINGYGVIGKRVADAIKLQDDMELVGVADIAYDYRVKVAALKGYNIYASIPEKRREMEAAGLDVKGTLEDLMKEVDIIVDCTPKGVGAKNRLIYERHGKKAIFQGGEKHEVAGVSFVAQCNYNQAIGKQFVRVVSCNTTGLCRTLNAIKNEFGIKRARAVLVRRGCDPWESSRQGPLNTVVPEVKIPSHQGPDAQTVIPDLNIVTMACNVPVTLSHMHFVMVEPKEVPSRDEVIKVFRKTPRVKLFRASDGFDGLQAIIEYHRDILRPRADVWEVPIWEESITVSDGEIFWIMQVHNEAIVIPENIDAIRAMMEIELDGLKSIEKTDRSLGLIG
ncbi:MAG: type II glyceraldehyde-3-phosphate dehydrogenase [Candidatus Methanomethylicia archaeon]